MSDNPDDTSEDNELIECARCGKVLNGVSLWIVCWDERDLPDAVCEECYAVWSPLEEALEKRKLVKQ